MHTHAHGYKEKKIYLIEKNNQCSLRVCHVCVAYMYICAHI